jgi:hypothetical protein
MRFRLPHKIRYLDDGRIASVAETLLPLAPARVIYGDGTDKHDTIFVIESSDTRFQLIGTYGDLIGLTNAINNELYAWAYNNNHIGWFGYQKPNREERQAGNGQE